jgi:hypothetical protein
MIKGWVDADGNTHEKIYDIALSDATQRAFYYVHVIESPTPRWTTYDAAFYGIKRPDNVPETLQDRAYTSSIWYTPKS